MSLLNKMLQDLDNRAANIRVLPDSVRPLPVARRNYWPAIAGVVVIVVILGAGATAWLSQRSPAAPAPVAMAAVTPSPAVPAQPPPAALAPTPVVPASAAPEATAAALMPPVAPAPRAPAATQHHVLQLETALRLPAAKQTRPAAPPAGAKAPDIPTPTTSAASSATIEKRVKTSTASERADAEYRLGLAQMQQGRLPEARGHWQAALHEDATQTAARQGLIGLAMEQKRYDEAEQLLRQGLEVQSGQTAWASTLARLRVERGDPAGALEILNRHAAAAASSADYQGFMGAVLQRLSRHKEAEERYQAASRLAPGDGRWWVGLGISLESLGRSGEAREAFRRARASGNLTPELAAFAEQKSR